MTRLYGPRRPGPPFGGRRRLVFLALLVIVAAGPMAAACGGGDGSTACSPGPPMAPDEWQKAVAAVDESVRLAEQGKGQEAVDFFFAQAHDRLHLAVFAVCGSDGAAARRLQKALDKLHFEFDPERPQALRQLLLSIKETLPQVSKAAGIPSG